MSGPDGLSIAHGVMRFADLFGVVLVDPNEPPTARVASLFAALDRGSWEKIGMIDDLVVAINVSRHGPEQFVVLCETGKMFFAGSGDQHIERLPEITPQMWRGLDRIGDRLFATGLGYRVCRRDGQNQWTALSGGLPAASHELAGFETVCGFSDRELYAAGWHGEVWRFDGTVWHDEGSPTNQVIGSSLAASDGLAYLCGRQGTLLAGRQGRWRILNDPEDGVVEDFWSLAEFDGSIYVASEQAIYRIVQDELETVRIDAHGYSGTHYQLSVADGHLCSIGANDILIFDGRSWTRMT